MASALAPAVTSSMAWVSGKKYTEELKNNSSKKQE
jgi:hypothetical protein